MIAFEQFAAKHRTSGAPPARVAFIDPCCVCLHVSGVGGVETPMRGLHQVSDHINGLLNRATGDDYKVVALPAQAA
jgi:hypothetical protein